MPDGALVMGAQFEDLVNTGEKTTIWVSCLPGKCGEGHVSATTAAD